MENDSGISEMISSVKDVLNGVYKELEGHHKPTKEWTQKIFDGLISKASELHLLCCPNNDGDSGWLYDMVWYKMTPDVRLSEVPLVLEMEWSTRNGFVQYDFEKLLLAKAALKVLIADGCGADLKDLVRNGITTFGKHDDGEIYLLAEYTHSGFKYTKFSWGNGTLNSTSV